MRNGECRATENTATSSYLQLTMKDQDLRNRTKQFALELLRFVEGLPGGETTRALRPQLLRSAFRASRSAFK